MERLCFPLFPRTFFFCPSEFRTLSYSVPYRRLQAKDTVPRQTAQKYAAFYSFCGRIMQTRSFQLTSPPQPQGRRTAPAKQSKLPMQKDASLGAYSLSSEEREAVGRSHWWRVLKVIFYFSWMYTHPSQDRAQNREAPVGPSSPLPAFWASLQLLSHPLLRYAQDISGCSALTTGDKIDPHFLQNHLARLQSWTVSVG